MKLYYCPGACSQAPHIALIETGLPFEIAKVDLATKRLDTGEDYFAINPKGAVPALEMDDGGLLTENAVVLQYIADHAPEARLIPPVGDARPLPRARMAQLSRDRAAQGLRAPVPSRPASRAPHCDRGALRPEVRLCRTASSAPAR